MKFFVPCNATAQDSEDCWHAIREWLEERGLFTTDRRIASLVCRVEGAEIAITVGERMACGELAVAILEASAEPGIFHVCAYRRGVFEGLPDRIAVPETWRVVDFEPEEDETA